MIASAPLPLVVDGDGLARGGAERGRCARDRPWPLVLTPHDGEYEAMTGAAPAADRFEAARTLAHDLRCVVLLKGSTTIVADETGRVLVCEPRRSALGDRRHR